jgi:hypothetical protein
MSETACDLLQEHAIRVRCAEEHLPVAPLFDYGTERLIEDARTSLAVAIQPAMFAWLPDVREYLRGALR